MGLMQVNYGAAAWLGNPYDPFVAYNTTGLKDLQVTPTRTILNVTSDRIDFRVTFLSPIEVRETCLDSYIR